MVRAGLFFRDMVPQEQYNAIGLQYSKRGDVLQFHHDPTIDWVVTKSGDIVVNISRWIKKPRFWGLLPGKVVTTCATNFTKTFKKTDRTVPNSEVMSLKLCPNKVKINEYSGTTRAYNRRR